MLAVLTDPQAWLAFLTLAALETVLGIDNIVFISILIAQLPRERQRAARLMGLALAMLTRIALLLAVVGLTRLTRPLWQIAGRAVSARDLILLTGGLFLLGKAVVEIHRTLEEAGRQRAAPLIKGLALIAVQIAAVDILFSLDSVFTAVGLANELPIMIGAIVTSILVMMWVSAWLALLLERHPSIKMLALAFLLLIGLALTAEGLHFEIPKGYLYFAMAFAVVVELVNLRVRARLQRGH